MSEKKRKRSIESEIALFLRRKMKPFTPTSWIGWYEKGQADAFQEIMDFVLELEEKKSK